MAMKSTSDLMNACVQACKTCIDSCESCRSEMLAANDIALAECVSSVEECSAACRACVEMIAGGAISMGTLAECIAECDECATECADCSMDCCAATAEACRACMNACAAMLKDMGATGKSSAPARLERRRHFDCGFQIKSVSESGVFSGYGSVYDVVDNYEDVVAKGAFADSLAEWRSKGRMPALLWQHNSDEPIGVYTAMSEDKNGLFVEGQLALKTQRGAEAYELMQMKAVSGLSIGFMTREDSFDQKTGIRTIKKADLWEVSVVTFPANDQARIDAVKTIEEIGDLNGAESYLREVGGITRSEAKAIVSRLFAIARREVGRSEDASADLKAITTLLERQRAALRA